jgi:CheY-like chemotaxis protein
MNSVCYCVHRVILDKIMKVLVVDDNVVNHSLTKVMLEDYSCAVEIAVNGKIAVEMAQKNTYDLIIMDVRMPVMNGMDAAKKIRKFNPAIPIIALTINDGLDARDACLNAGMNDFLEKPVEKSKLKSVLEQWGNEKIRSSSSGT